MESILLAIFFGYILPLIEGFMPGGVFGLGGVICIAWGSYFAYQEYPGFLAPTMTFTLGIIGACVIVFWQFKWLSKSRLGKSIFLSSTTEGVSNKNQPGDEIIGVKGKSLTEHKPEGIVLLNGQNYDAYCTDGYLPKEKNVIVTGKDDFRLRVKEI